MNRPRPRSGFTLVEVLVGAVLLMLLIGSMFTVLRTGSRVSLKGMTRIETTLEGYRLLQTLQTDLRQACYPMEYSGYTSYGFGDLMTANAGKTKFSWHAFPRLGTDLEAIQDDGAAGKAVRRASRITYRLTKTENDPGPFKTLTREEVFHESHPEASRHPGGRVVHVLSRRVNVFEIIPRTAEQQGVELWWVYFQLGDYPGVSREARLDDPAKMNPVNVILTDFYTVATSDHFTAQKKFTRVNANWHTIIRAPAAAPDP